MIQEAFVFPLSFAQERLWFLNQLQPDDTAYNMPTAVRLMGHLDVVALECSLNEIIRRHEALRTTFAVVDGNPKQIIAPTLELPLRVIDLQELSTADWEAAARRLASNEARTPFDLAQGPLVRTTLLRLNLEEHVLLVTMHHIIADGWSVSVFFRELSALYQSYASGKPSQLLELPIQYADFTVWQREWLQGEVSETQLAYWKRQLHDAPMVLELPADHPRPAMQSFRGATQSCILPITLAEKLTTLSRREGATLFMTLLAAFQTLLYRYTGQDDIIVGSPIAGRNQVETEELIGFFVNTLVLRTDLSGNPSFRELVGRVRELALEAYTHQDLPFEKLIEALQPSRDLSRSPLFQVMFVLQNAPMGKLELPGLTLTPLDIESVTAKFDLTLFMRETAQGLQATMEYSTDLFDATTITRMLGHFQTLLEGIVADPNRRLSELPFLTEAEVRQVLVEWNRTKADYPQDVCVHELFEAQVECTPDAVALVFEDQQLTYRELNCRANHLAHSLRTRGVGPEVPVGICMERSLEMVVGLLGILKAGGAYVPLDPAYPQERVAFMLADTQATVLLSQKRLAARLPAHRTQVVAVDAEWERMTQHDEENMTSGTTADNCAYVIYTSGSTGKPKGVAIEHQSVTTLLYWARDMFPSADLAGVLASTSICFDLSVFELFTPLSWGGTVILAKDALHLPTLPGAKDVTLLNTVPSAMAELLRMGGVPASVRTVNLAGEALQHNLVQQIYTQTATERVLNLYGPSEDTTYSTVALLGRGANGSPSIGRPIANTQVYLLDRHLQPVPIGVPGEIYLGGHGLARGYLHRPELTAEQFMPHPFSDEPGARLYKTGDLARYLPDGNLQFLGRVDHQVKLRGFRIEPGEIEAVLGQHPAVRQAVVLTREDTPGDTRLVAYVVPQQEPPPTSSALRSFLQQKLPGYMVPSAFVLVNALPLTPNGKLDRRALSAPEQTRSQPQDTCMAPQDALELQLTKIWEKVLGITPIGVRENFFELGGHSLLAVRLFAQIKKAFGRQLPLATLFQAPTVEQLAGMLRQEGWSAPWSCLVAIQPGGSKPPFFCIHGSDGHVGLSYYELARHLGSDHPVYGLQALGLDGDTAPLTRFEDMAAHYLTEIRSLQPEGPYFLGGACFGGILALEVAQQLHAQGQQVALLVLFDASPRAYAPSRAATASPVALGVYLTRKLTFHLRELRLLAPQDRHAYVQLRVRYLTMIVKQSLWERLYAYYRRHGSPLPRALRHMQFMQEKALADYVPQPYAGPILLFASGAQVRWVHDAQLGWSRLANGGLEVHILPCYHENTLREPHVRVVAEHLRAALREHTDLGATQHVG
jgi:amino acid adenylation domain-containing protein